MTGSAGIDSAGSDEGGEDLLDFTRSGHGSLQHLGSSPRSEHE